MTRPVPASVGVTFAYLRKYKNGKPHKGVDFGAKKGTKVTAAIAGTVWYAGNGGGWGPSYGAHVIIKGTVNGAVRYVQVAHLSRIDVKTGQKVTAGKQLGLSGGVPGQWGAGNSTGNHVHFQVNKSSAWADHVDPWPAIEQGAKTAPATPVSAETVVYVVTADPTLNGRDRPVTGAIAKTAKNGAIITSVGFTAKQSDGHQWVKNTEGLFWSKKYLKVKPKPTPKAKTTIRPLWYNIPGADKLPKSTDRAKAGAALIKSGKPTVFGLNELVGPGKNSTTNSPSSFAKAIHSALGTTAYGIVVPTTAYNENYIFFEKATTGLVKRYPDLLVYAKVGGKMVPGRHLTVAAMKDLVTGDPYVFGVTHLVDGKEWGAGRTAQAKIIRAELDRIAALHGNCPIFVGGDVNRSDDLLAFTTRGLTNLRKKAKATTSGTSATYSNIKNQTIGTNPDWIIDHGYGPSSWTVNGYTVLRGYVAGKFPSLRPSDHVPILFSVTSP